MTENTFDCPKALWGKMSEEDRAEYNRCMDRTDYDAWAMLENGEMIKDRKLLAHNFLISILPSFQGDN